MKHLFAAAALLGLLSTSLSAQEKEGKPEARPVIEENADVVPASPIVQQVEDNTSLVKVNVTFQQWNSRIPWQKTSPGARRGLGVLLAGNQILVTAQMVADSTYIELEQGDSGRRMPAKVKAVDYDANLAILLPSGDPKEFLAGLKPLEIETNAKIGDELLTWQLGRVGDLITSPLEINKVLVSRYVLETSLYLVYETIGIIRSESSTFTIPVVKDGKLAGLLLRYDPKNQTSTVLPGPIIAHFLKDNADGSYQGFPTFGVELQQTLDEQFREYLGMKKEQQGIYVGEVKKDESAANIGVKAGDIIMEVNGHKVDARGDYKDDIYGTLHMSHLVRGNSFVGDTLNLKVLRAGKEMALSGKLIRKNAAEYIVPPYQFDRGANYLVQGGLVFGELSLPFLQAFGDEWEAAAPPRLLFVARHPDEYEKAGYRKIVFLAAALPTRSTQGYERLGGMIVSKVNAHDVKDLADLDRAFKDPQNGVHDVEFEEFPKRIFMDAFTTESDNIKLLNGSYGAYRIGALKRIE